MADTKGKVAAMIVAKMKPKADAVSVEPEEAEGEDVGAEAAAEELLSAISSGDASALVAAFRSMKELC